jgi:hypothetical protein
MSTRSLCCWQYWQQRRTKWQARSHKVASRTKAPQGVFLLSASSVILKDILCMANLWELRGTTQIRECRDKNVEWSLCLRYDNYTASLHSLKWAKGRLCQLAWFSIAEWPIPSSLMLYKSALFRNLQPHPLIFGLPITMKDDDDRTVSRSGSANQNNNKNDNQSVEPTNSTPNKSTTHSTPRQNTRASNSHQFATDVVARAAAVIRMLAIRLIN